MKTLYKNGFLFLSQPPNIQEPTDNNYVFTLL